MKWPRWLPVRRLARLAPGAAALAALGAIGGFVVVFTGAYNVAATEPHLLPVYRLLDIAMRQSVRARAADIEVPPLDDPGAIALGLRCFRQHCAQCHGAPGIAPDEAARGLMPLPASLVQTALDWPPEELYWATRHGIRTTGMPAWEFRMSEEALWATVAFLEILPTLTVERYAAMGASADNAPCPDATRAPPTAVQLERGRAALHQYACITCHRIPGIAGPHTYAGPPLAGMGRRTYIAGMLPNTFENMVRWLRDPRAVSPLTLMPDLGVSEADARDMAAYLTTLEEPEPWSVRAMAPAGTRAHSGAAAGDVTAGRQALARFGCTTCHTIPGVDGPRGLVGPPLDAWSRHPYIAGKLPNEPEMLVRWIVDPPSLAPETAMPNSGVSEREARDMAAYLYTLE